MSENQELPKISHEPQPEQTKELLEGLRSTVEELNIRLEVIFRQRNFFSNQLTEESVNLLSTKNKLQKEQETVDRLKSEIEKHLLEKDKITEAKNKAVYAAGLAKVRLSVLLEVIQIIMGDSDDGGSPEYPTDINYNSISAWLSKLKEEKEERLNSLKEDLPTFDGVVSGDIQFQDKSTDLTSLIPNTDSYEAGAESEAGSESESEDTPFINFK